MKKQHLFFRLTCAEALIAVVLVFPFSCLPTFKWTVDATSCASAPARKELPGVGLMVGHAPLWFVDGSTGVWRAREPVKSLWVLSRQVVGSLRLEGRRLDGPGVLEFQENADSAPTTVLEIADPWHGPIIIGGPKVTRAYAFVPTYVFYPSAGCWELTAHLGNHEVKITRELKRNAAAVTGW